MKNLNALGVDLFEIVWGLAISVLFVIFIIFITSDHKVNHYYITGQENNIKIGLDIDWSADDEFSLDRNVTYSEAIEIVERLNKTLK